MNVGVRTPSTKTFTMRTPKGTTQLVFGLATDRPIAGDWDGDRKWTPGLWRPSEHQFIQRHANGSVTRVYLGDADDLPVVGDWDGDKITDLGVFDQATATFTLRRLDQDGTEWIAKVQFGKPGAQVLLGRVGERLGRKVGRTVHGEALPWMQPPRPPRGPMRAASWRARGRADNRRLC